MQSEQNKLLNLYRRMDKILVIIKWLHIHHFIILHFLSLSNVKLF